ncbi:tRNA-dependent cyclodipeptide synthase [Allonocardiopsis opalescens]|uniref:Cyclodipeptide synthase n=1 Tax=Allonocardiopsis opalescens TaxID=1144618 RepID=A0A2T0Q4T3_9ACTN|nr:tRNA-dependent cyclodipeptide synthase [Allonocardiopsis opalescens]PRX98827.1 cyclo(L-leucyl-L-leucyl) synthase [Allonocardiopsis opalescens]
MGAQYCHAQPLTGKCAEIYRRGRHALIGISPFNSKFSTEYLILVARWANETFRSFDFLLAGDEAALLLEATGTPAGRARYKSRKAVRRNLRSVQDALAHLGRPARARILNIADFTGHEVYAMARKEGAAAFAADPEFRAACLEMVDKAVRGRMRTVDVAGSAAVPEQLERAVEYVLAELPFLTRGPEVVGVEEFVVVYHQSWPLYERILAGEFPLTVHPAQGYVNLDQP